MTRGDIVRVLARDDRAIAIDVRHRLEIYGGLNRWTVHVQDGVVQVLDTFDNTADRHAAAMLAQAVPGVVDAETTPTVTATKNRIVR